jgi:Tfp pilus assembly ATPase PilU
VVQQPRNRELRDGGAVAFAISSSDSPRWANVVLLVRAAAKRTNVSLVFQRLATKLNRFERIHGRLWIWLLFVTKSGFIVRGGERPVIGSLAWKCNLRAKTIRGSRRTFADQLLTVF